MAKKGEDARYLGPTKPESFGVALRASIKEEFGTNTEFAKALGVSKGRVTQLIKGPDDVNAESLVKVLQTFKSFRFQERIHSAWVREFAPLPTPSAHDLDPAELLGRIHELGEDGLSSRALQLARTWQGEVKDDEAWQLLGRQIVEISLRLTKVGGAVAALQDNERRAMLRSEPRDILTALWMKGLVLRQIDNVSIEVLDRAHEDAISYAEHGRPSAKEESQIWKDRRALLDRDFALHLLALNERKAVGTVALQHALSLVNRSIEQGPSEPFIRYGLEVRARIEGALGEKTVAEETLDQLRAIDKGGELREKAELTRATLLAARGERDEAEAIFEAIAEDCFERMNFHHHRKADQLLARLRAGI